MNNEFIEPDWSKEAALEFAQEYCKKVDDLFIEGLKDIHQQINIVKHLQSCIDQTSRSYGFKVK